MFPSSVAECGKKEYCTKREILKICRTKCLNLHSKIMTNVITGV